MSLGSIFSVFREDSIDVSYQNILLYIVTVKPVYNDHPRDPKFVAVVDRLFRGSFKLYKLKMEPPNGDHCGQVAAVQM